MINPNARIDYIALDAHTGYLQIDDFLLDPALWVAKAAAHRRAFDDSSANAYPGFELRMPDSITQQIMDFLEPLMKSYFGLQRLSEGFSRLSMVTRSPAQLEPRQWICHRDRLKVACGQMAIASVLYLFQESELGGTNFFRPRQSALDTDILVHDSSTMDAPGFALKYGLHAGYMTGSNAYFDRIGHVPARWNRMLVYDGMVFHSGDIIRPEAMTDDPQTGRLSLNGFFTGERGLG